MTGNFSIFIMLDNPVPMTVFAFCVDEDLTREIGAGGFCRNGLNTGNVVNFSKKLARSTPHHRVFYTNQQRSGRLIITPFKISASASSNDSRSNVNESFKVASASGSRFKRDSLNRLPDFYLIIVFLPC